MSRSHSLERCFSHACGWVMAFVPWSNSGFETSGFEEVFIFFFFLSQHFIALIKKKPLRYRALNHNPGAPCLLQEKLETLEASWGYLCQNLFVGYTWFVIFSEWLKSLVEE